MHYRRQFNGACRWLIRSAKQFCYGAMCVLLADLSFVRIVLGGMRRVLVAVQAQQQYVGHHCPDKEQQ